MKAVKLCFVAILVVSVLVFAMGCEDESDDESREVESSEGLDSEDESEKSSAETSTVKVEESEDGDSEKKTDDDEDSQKAEDDEEDQPEDDDDVDWASEYGHLPFYATGPVAVVDGEEISPRDFNQTADAQFSQMPPDAFDAEADEILELFLNAVIVAHILEREVEKRGIEVSDAEIDGAIEEFKEMLRLQLGGDAAMVDSMLAQQGVSEAELRMQAEQDLLAEKLITETREINVSEAEIRQFYESNKAMFQQVEAARVRHILLHVENGDDDSVKAQAQRLAQRLEEGASFSSLAKNHSDCRSAPQGGELGYITRQQVVPEFAEVAFSAPVGSISEPVRSSLGWHVIEVQDRQEEGMASLEEVRDDLRMLLEAQQLQTVAVELIEELREEADVEVKKGNIVVEGR